MFRTSQKIQPPLKHTGLSTPVVVVDEKQMFKLDEPEGLTTIVAKAIF